MRITWDENKRRANLRKHGVDFLDAALVFDGHVVTWEDNRFAYGEERLITLGMMRGLVVYIVHSNNPDIIHLISARKATNYETAVYFDSL